MGVGQQGGETESTWRHHSADFAIIWATSCLIIMNETAMVTTYKYGDDLLCNPPPRSIFLISSPPFHHVAIYHTRLESVSLHKRSHQRPYERISKKSSQNGGFGTRAIHVGSEPSEETGAVIPAISLSTTYKQDAVGVHKVSTQTCSARVAPDNSHRDMSTRDL